MAIRSYLGLDSPKQETITDRAGLLAKFQSQEHVVVSTGTTCAYLGDGRNYREYLVAADAVRVLKEAGHTVEFLLFDDNLDPLNSRQLRVAVGKNPELVQRYLPFCGKPIALLPSPEDEEGVSWAEHFQRHLRRRLAEFDCYPNVYSVAKLYEKGIYDRYVALVLEHGKDILLFLKRTFPTYSPSKLFHPICPACGSIAGARLTSYGQREAIIDCDSCDMTSAIPPDALQGKLNWKLDCAARWHHFGIDLEPFTKPYLDPTGGSVPLATALGTAFFGPIKACPLLVGTVKVDREISSKALMAVPPSLFQRIMTERWSNDITLSKTRLALEASKKTTGSLPYSSAIKRLLPSMSVRKQELSIREQEQAEQAGIFAKEILDEDLPQFQPTLEPLSRAPLRILRHLQEHLKTSYRFKSEEMPYEDFERAVLALATMDAGDRDALHRLIRETFGHPRGLPVRRLLYTVPLEVLRLVQEGTKRAVEARELAVELAKLRSATAMAMNQAVVSLDQESPQSQSSILTS